MKLHQVRKLDKKNKEKFGKVAVLCGGYSSEREISLVTGKAVWQALLNKGINEFGAALPGNDERRESFAQNLRRSIMRSMPTEDEATRLIGGILDATTALQYVGGNDGWKRQRRRKITPFEEE